jgi:hypothetical protein
MKKSGAVDARNNSAFYLPFEFSSRYLMDVVVDLNLVQTSDQGPIKYRTKSRSNSIKVQFDAFHHAFEVISRDEYTQEEIENTWYSKEEFTQRIKTLDRSDTISIKRRRNILRGWMVVGKEQARQRKLRVNDPESMAVAYSLVSQPCCTEAYKSALWNEIDNWDF